MRRQPKTPGEIEIYGFFRKHIGPRFIAAGLGIQFHYNQEPGIHFKVEAPSEYSEAIIKGLRDAMRVSFPEFPSSASIWITRIQIDAIDSSWMAFYQAARMVIEQAFSTSQPDDAG